MSKHTPGPWDVDEGDKSTVYELETADPIAEVFTDRSAEENEANARLIAAAPDLLEVLKRTLEEDADGHVKWQTRKDARAAIAKAEGRT